MPNHDGFNRELAAAAREMQDEDSPKQAMERAVVIATEILVVVDLHPTPGEARCDESAAVSHERREFAFVLDLILDGLGRTATPS